MDTAGRQMTLRMVAVLTLALVVAGAAVALAGSAQADDGKRSKLEKQRKGSGLALVIETKVAGKEAVSPKQNYTCDKPTTKNRYAYGSCYLDAGVSARLRADCRWAIDRYSRWKSGPGRRDFRTINQCSWRGIRGAIYQIRGAGT